jgi:hypothetical protein
VTTAELRKVVDMKLAIIGYTTTDTDQIHLDYAVDQAAQYVCTYCNFLKCPDDIPKSLQYVVADYTIGRFLQYKSTFAPNDLKNLNLDTVVKQITTGDTTTTFAIGEGSQTDEQKLNAIIGYLTTYGKHELRCHRGLKW